MLAELLAVLQDLRSCVDIQVLEGENKASASASATRSSTPSAPAGNDAEPSPSATSADPTLDGDAATTATKEDEARKVEAETPTGARSSANKTPRSKSDRKDAGSPADSPIAVCCCSSRFSHVPLRCSHGIAPVQRWGVPSATSTRVCSDLAPFLKQRGGSSGLGTNCAFHLWCCSRHVCSFGHRCPCAQQREAQKLLDGPTTLAALLVHHTVGGPVLAGVSSEPGNNVRFVACSDIRSFNSFRLIEFEQRRKIVEAAKRWIPRERIILLKRQRYGVMMKALAERAQECKQVQHRSCPCSPVRTPERGYPVRSTRCTL